MTGTIDWSKLVTAEAKAQAAAAAEAALVPRPRCDAAAFNIAVDDGEISTIEAGAGISAGFALGDSTFMLFFAVPQPDASYFPKLSATGARMRVAEDGKASDYLIVNATDAQGQPADPESFSVEIWRVD